MKIFFSVGEPSGDLHGANLIRELRELDPDIECVGYGGPRMGAAGCDLHEDLTQWAVMWILQVVLNLHQFWRLYRRAAAYFRDARPDAVVLIDYPGFNWWIARAAKRHGIAVFYYGVPQMWAWASWRVRKMRRLVDHVLCKLPFEETWYRERGCHATYIGHPYFDQMQRQQLDVAFSAEQAGRPGRLVTILPGSRTQEVIHNLTDFLAAAGKIRQAVSDARFAIASFDERHAALAREQIARANLPVEVFTGRTPELIYASHCCLACSGSVSLELLYHVKPTVVLYRVGWLGYALARRLFLKVKFITLVNLLAAEDPFLRDGAMYDSDAAAADSVLFPEYLTYADRSSAISEHVIRWLRDPACYAQRVGALAALKQRVAVAGASRGAARYILEHARRGALHAHASRDDLANLNEIGKSQTKTKNSP